MCGYYVVYTPINGKKKESFMYKTAYAERYVRK